MDKSSMWLLCYAQYSGWLLHPGYLRETRMDESHFLQRCAELADQAISRLERREALWQSVP